MGEQAAGILVAALGKVPEVSELEEAPSDFPAFDPLHANCAMTTNVSAKCTDYYYALEKTL